MITELLLLNFVRTIDREYKIPNNYPDFYKILASYLILLGLSEEEIRVHSSTYTIGIAHEIANLFAITEKLPIYCLDQELLEQMIAGKDNVQQAITPPAGQKVPFGLKQIKFI